MDPSTLDHKNFTPYQSASAWRRIVYVALAVTMALTAITPAIPAYAHNGEEHDDAAHAEEDMADTSVETIEKMTNENKQKILKATGVEPGSAKAINNGKRISGQAVSTDPGISGKWSPAIETQVVPVFQAVLPNGKILIWDSVGDNATETYPTHKFTRALVWNPANDTFKRVDVQGYNIFCAGFAHLQNGNILVAGGNKDAKLAGIVQTHVFNWRTETWTRGKDMKAGRWYPSLATMANGEVAIVGGGPAGTEVYQTNGAIRQVTGFTNTTYAKRLYPFMTSRPDTQLQLMGPYNTMYTVNTAGTGAVTGSINRDGRDRQYGSFATYGVGKVMIVGGGSFTENNIAKVPTRTSVLVNTNTGLRPTTTALASMPGEGRRQHNATMLADGSVLVTGGLSSTAQSSLVDMNHATTAALRWNPDNNTWTTLASASRVRQYHSTAALLPDGRVITGGGGICGDCMKYGYLEKNIEYFTPPYLYKKDGSGELAARPAIASAPAAVTINTNFTVTSAQAASIKKVALVGLADVTHSIDQGQRYIPLKFTRSGNALTATSPATGGIAPPGYYMLFITDTNGVPSVAKIVQVAKSPNPLMSPVKNKKAGRCLDVPGSSLKNKTYLQSYACNSGRAQAATRLINDGSIRILGNCLEVPSGKYASGKKIWMNACNGGKAQKWEFRADKTIRPTGKTSLCLAASSTKSKATIVLKKCSSSTLQRWAW